MHITRKGSTIKLPDDVKSQKKKLTKGTMKINPKKPIKN